MICSRRSLKNFGNAVLLFCCICGSKLKSQDILWRNSSFGVNAGVNAAFGSHFRRFGFTLNFYYIYKRIQANTELRGYYSYRNLGPQFIFPELCFSQGLVYAFGATRNYFNPFLNSVSYQGNYSNSAGYAYSFWVNKMRTHQQTGTIAVYVYGFGFVSENDLFARPVLDKFRTGAFLFSYRYRDQFETGINCTLWTGRFGRRMESGGNEKIGNTCYMDTVDGLFMSYSHGLLSAQLKYHAGLGQTIHGSAGVDAEQVRDFVQNTLIHNATQFSTKKGKHKNCYMPMLDNYGNQYLFQEGQQIRKAKPYWNLFMNGSLFY